MALLKNTEGFVGQKAFDVNKFRAHWSSNEKLRFLIVGAYNTAFGYGAFALLYWLFGSRAHYLALLAVAHAAAVTNAFLAHRWLTYKANGSWWAQYFRFNLSNLALTALSLLLTAILVETLGWHPLLAAAVTVIVTTTASYFAHRIYSFRE